MPQKPQYIHDLITSVELLKDRTGNLREDVDNLGKALESLK